MERFFCFALFFSVISFFNLALGEKDQVIYYASTNRRLEIELPTTVKREELIESVSIKTNGKKYDLFFGRGNDTADHGRIRLNFRQSTLFIDVYYPVVKDTGKWLIAVTEKSSNTTSEYNFDIYVRESISDKYSLKPASVFHVYKGQTVTVGFSEELEDRTKCRLMKLPVGPFCENLEVLSNSTCEIKMTIDEDSKGHWALIAEGDDITYMETFEIIVIKYKELEIVNWTLLLDQPGHIKANNTGIKLCIVEDPHQVRYSPFLPTSSSECIYKISKVSQKHEGVWKIFYAVAGSSVLIEQKIRVTTETPVMDFSIESSSTRNFSLLCKSKSSPLSYCTFEHPDGTVIFMEPGVGNDKYKYYGKGYGENNHDNDHQDCGITVQNPDDSDYGAWKCIMGWDHSRHLYDNSATTGTILKVDRPNTKKFESIKIEGKDVYAKLNTSYKIKCSADEILSYCWLQSPNGTIFNVLDNPDESMNLPTLKYVGEGLNFGDCSAFIQNATDSDRGEWQCHMGIKDGPEKSTNVKVRISKSFLKPQIDKTVHKSSENLKLRFEILPGLDTHIVSCRWISPAGSGIHIGMHNRYSTSMSTNYCELQIQDLLPSKDVGEWRCLARFAGSDNEEIEKVTITLASKKALSLLSVGLTVSFFFCATLVGIYALLVGRNNVFRLTARLSPNNRDSYRTKFISENWTFQMEDQKTEKIPRKF